MFAGASCSVAVAPGRAAQKAFSCSVSIATTRGECAAMIARVRHAARQSRARRLRGILCAPVSRSRAMRIVLATALLAAAAFAQAGDVQPYGKPVPQGDTVAVSAAIADFDAHAGEPRRFSGRIAQ